MFCYNIVKKIKKIIIDEQNLSKIGVDFLNNKFKLICPVCQKYLSKDEKRFICENNHSFDIARQGYVNLLPVQNKHSLNPGDTKESLLARREFLNQNKYFPICQSVIDILKKYVSSSSVLLDIGCGEGYYTTAFERECKINCIGIDISKDGIKMACSRSKNILWLVATASQLPILDNSADVVTAMFSLLLQDEYARVLKKGGYVIEITVGTNHLKELKEIIYDTLFEQHKHPSKCGEHFDEIICNELNYKIELNNSELKNLLIMTPHFWRIHKEKREILENMQTLELTVNYWVRVLKKL